MTNNQIKWILQKLREERYPSDDKYLQNISNIKITFDNSANLQNLPFCYKLVNLINQKKNNTFEKYLIFTSKFQINLVTKCEQIFIDGTFKISPVGYYQIINICGFLKEIDGIIPLFMIPVTGKSQYLYENVLKDVLTILNENNIELKDIPKKFMLDFEPGLQNAVKKIFKGVQINGCYFHYVKILWDHAKKYGLCTKDELKKVKILIFILKLFPYMDIDEKEQLFNKVEEFYTSQEKYKRFIKYFKKYWVNNEYLNFIELTEKEYLMRTNNYLENFHCLINKSIEVFHPKLSYLIYKYKLFLLGVYEKLKDGFVINILPKKEI